MMIEAAREHGLADDPILRQRLAEYHSKIQIIRINGLRSLTQSVTGKKDPGVAVLGATTKLWWSEMHNAAMELAVDIYGPEAMLRTTGPESSQATTRPPSPPAGYTRNPKPARTQRAPG